MELQGLLNDLGYDAGTPDGRLDSHTRSAIRAFQKDRGLVLDELPSPALLEHLRGAVAAAAVQEADDRSVGQQSGTPTSEPVGSTILSAPTAAAPDASQVLEIQSLLSALGYPVGTPDGKLGQQTRSAIVMFQHDSDLPADGEPTIGLLEVLRVAMTSSVTPGDQSADLADVAQAPLDEAPRVSARVLDSLRLVLIYTKLRPDLLDDPVIVERLAGWLFADNYKEAQVHGTFDVRREVPKWRQWLANLIESTPPTYTHVISAGLEPYDFGRGVFPLHYPGIAIGPDLNVGGIRIDDVRVSPWARLDRRFEMKALHLPPEEAEIYHQRHGRQIHVKVDLTFTGVERVEQMDRLVARLAGLEIYGTYEGGEFLGLIMAQNISALPNVADLEAAEQAKALAAETAQEEKEKQERMAAVAAERRLARYATELESCDQAASPEERLSCIEDVCRGIASDPNRTSDLASRCDKAVLLARTEIANEERRAVGEQNTREAECRHTFVLLEQRYTWIPSDGSLERNAAIQDCIAAPDRTSYGPDVVGLRLGDSENEALRAVSNRLDSSLAPTLKDPRPFENAQFIWSQDGSEGIALFTVRNNARRVVAGISRRLYFDSGGPATAEILEGLRNKYGDETWLSGDGTWIWAFSQHALSQTKEGCEADECAALAGLVVPRDGWSRAWQRQFSTGQTDQAPPQAAQQHGAQSQAYLACVQRLEAELAPMIAQAGHGHSGDTADEKAYVRLFNMGMEACQSSLGSREIMAGDAAPQEQAARLPMMIDVAGNQSLYAKFAGLGPVLVVRLTQSDKLEDASFALFDPAWLATRPSFAFVEEGAGDAKSNQEKIEF
jgi:peptidoglycan hydrolase-like protein with peptidoglycan-binding domain